MYKRHTRATAGVGLTASPGTGGKKRESALVATENVSAGTCFSSVYAYALVQCMRMRVCAARHVNMYILHMY
jgi:hypothetical protein